MEVLFITTNNLVTNPRLVKEVHLALDNRINPTVVCFDFDNWTLDLEDELRKSLEGVKFITIKTKAFNWLIASFLHSIYNKFSFLVGDNIERNAYVSDKRSYLIYNCLKSTKLNYDLIVCHNLGTLFPAYKLSELNNIPFAFDIEDFHPGEVLKVHAKKEIFRRKQLMSKLLPKAFYISYASPLIGASSLQLLNPQLKLKHLLLNNSFSSSEFKNNFNITGRKVSFVWFSQNISIDRGLEQIVPILYKYKSKVQLTLIGNLNPSFYDNFLKEFLDVISIIEPISQKELHSKLGNFDIGLAIDLSSSDLNRDLCLTNKIFAYSQAGLYILATNTQAHKLFINENPELGTLVEQSSIGYENSIKKIISQKDRIREERQLRFGIGDTLSWERESEKLLMVWQSVEKKS
jgi:hypothetical protein